MPPADPMQAPGNDAILAQLRELLGEILGEDLLEAVPVELQTRFTEDLEMQSVEFVAFAEGLHERFPGVDLVEWVSDMPAENLPSLTVGQLVDLIAWHLGGGARELGGVH